MEEGNQQLTNELIQVLETSKKDFAWMSHIPLPRVIQILVESVGHSLSDHTPERQQSLITPLCVTASGCHRSVNSLLEGVSRESAIWDDLEKTAKEENFPVPLQLLIYSQRPQTFEKKLLNTLQELDRQSSSDLGLTANSSCTDIFDMTPFIHCLSHHCSSTIVKDPENYYILSRIVYCSDHFLKVAFDLLKCVLQHCNYSIRSIKTATLFSKIIFDKAFKGRSQLYPPDFLELYDLLNGPACVQCNDMLSSESDLEHLTTKMSLLLEKRDSSSELNFKTLFCMHSEWLMHSRNIPAVRYLFLNIL